MKRLTRYQLDFNITFPYAVDHIDEFTALSTLFKNEFTFDKGHFFIDLPENCQIQRLHELGSGGMTPKFDCGLEKEKTKQGKEFIPRRFLSTDQEITHFIYQLLSRNVCKIAIFDEILDSRGEQKNALEEMRVLYNGNEIYYVATSESTFDEVDEAFSQGEKMWRTFGIMLDSEVKFSEEFINDNRSIILNHTRYLIIGAYDGEAYVVWEKNQ